MLTHEVFSAALNTKFLVEVAENQNVELNLEYVSELKLYPRQEEFSLVFRGPNEAFLGQGTRRMRHETIGSLQLFLVPIGQEPEGYRYEAVFNLFRK